MPRNSHIVSLFWQGIQACFAALAMNSHGFRCLGQEFTYVSLFGQGVHILLAVLARLLLFWPRIHICVSLRWLGSRIVFVVLARNSHVVFDIVGKEFAYFALSWP